MKRMLLLLLITLSGCGGSHVQQTSQPARHSLRLETVATAASAQGTEVAGLVQSRITSLVSSRTVGQILAVHVREGDVVQKGQLLAEIDSRDAMALVRRAEAGTREAERGVEEAERGIEAAKAAQSAAEAALRLTTATYQRYQTLAERRSVSRQEFDEVEARYRASTADYERAQSALKMAEARLEQARARVEQGKAELNLAQVQTSYSKITAPHSGTVTLKALDAGSLASPGVTLFKIESTDGYRVEAALEESRISSVRLGDTVKVRIEALGKEYKAKVVEIVPAANTQTRSFLVRAALPEDSLLRPGMYAKVLFQSKDEQRLITLPKSAIIARGQLTGVVVVRDGSALYRLVKLGREIGERVEVLSGLKEGDIVVVESPQMVKDGDLVVSR